MKLTKLTSDNDQDNHMFDEWMAEVAKLCDEHWACDRFDPMGDSELPAVSILLGAAARSGLSPVSEYQLVKNVDGDQRGGRADLWFNRRDSCRSFEFKSWRNQHWGKSDLMLTLKYANSCAEQIPIGEYDRIYGGVIARIAKPEAVSACLEVSRQVDFAYRFEALDNYDLFLFFNSLNRSDPE